ncbi:MAG TPA: PilZ domain-containing protein [Candidatus Baltobacteraceae bacterium]|nr:PilZ domain-containing protein [Candidatus Baltobacteraceae bacterium]
MTKNERSGYRQPVDLPVQVSVSGIRIPVNATIVDVSVTGCRLRSWIALERGSKVAFDWPREHVDLRLTGSVMARRPSDQGGAFEYGVSFAGLLPAQGDLLAREIAEAQRREALNRGREAAAMNVSPAQFNRRHTYRARAEFSVDVTFEERKTAAIKVTATDISVGGLRIVCERELTSNDEVTVRFRLPDNVLGVFPPGVREDIVMTPFGPRRRAKNNRRPFEEMRIRSRIANRLKDWHGRPAFGVAFVEIDAYSREEIARFIHAVQLGQLRERKAHR